MSHRSTSCVLVAFLLTACAPTAPPVGSDGITLNPRELSPSSGFELDDGYDAPSLFEPTHDGHGHGHGHPPQHDQDGHDPQHDDGHDPDPGHHPEPEPEPEPEEVQEEEEAQEDEEAQEEEEQAEDAAPADEEDASADADTDAEAEPEAEPEADRAAASCAEILDLDPDAESGIYRLDPLGTGEPTDFVCDMDREGGGWTLAGRQFADGVDPLGIGDWGELDSDAFSSDLAGIVFHEVLVFNDTYDLSESESYDKAVWDYTDVNLRHGVAGNAFQHGGQAPRGVERTMMACVGYNYSGTANRYMACDSDHHASGRGHIADDAGEYCEGGRLDGTWAWTDGATCRLRGVPYVWGYAIR